MAKYIDADKLIEEIGISKICEECQYVNGALCMWNVNGDFVGVCETIIDAPAADVVPVIRCRDCKHWLPHRQFGWDDEFDRYDDYCGLLVPEDDYYAVSRNADDFCSYAERREND